MNEIIILLICLIIYLMFAIKVMNDKGKKIFDKLEKLDKTMEELLP